jgi:multicomponent K+:H+ antiporter subunit D
VNQILNSLLLLAVPLLPLLLAIPALRLRLPKALYIALLPAVVVVVTPVTFSAELSWMMFGSELELGGFNRLLLVMSVIVWVFVLFRVSTETTTDNPLLTFLLLVMAGNFGAIVAADLLLFFSFTTLMGYSFYALLVASDNTIRTVARVYLWLIIVADLLLFEVLLLMAVNSTNLNFASANTAVTLSPLQNLTLWLVILGFMMKAGIWPFHFWLLSAYRCAKPELTLLLAVAPVSMALLGLLRWLPLGEISSPVNGLIAQGIGVSTMLYALFLVLKKSGLNTWLPVYSVIFMGGLFLAGIGIGLTNAATWNRYEVLAYYFVIALEFAVVLWVALSGQIQLRHDRSLARTFLDRDSTLRLERYEVMLVTRVSKAGFNILHGWRAWWLAMVKHLWSGLICWQSVLDTSESKLSNWPVAITLFLLLGIVLVLVS